VARAACPKPLGVEVQADDGGKTGTRNCVDRIGGV